MRSEEEVQDHIRYLLTLELERRVAEARRRLPHQCEHNVRHPLDCRKRSSEGVRNEAYNQIAHSNGQTIGLCVLGSDDPQEWNGTICEDEADARRCEQYTSKVSKATVESEFNTQIKDLGWVQAHMPEVYGLLWALGSEQLPALPWWKRLWFKMVQIRPEPLER